MLSSFAIKILAIVTMLIDHLGYFFYYKLSSDIHVLCRAIGRISMPLFLFLVYQGFKHTSNLKKYAKRIGISAIVTQVIIVCLGIVINHKIPNYGLDFYMDLNILFSFLICLGLLKIIDNFVNNKQRKFKDVIIAVIAILAIVSLYFILRIEYGLSIPLLMVALYICDKLNSKKTVINTILKYCIVILVILATTFLLENKLYTFGILALLPIALYNGKNGKYNTKWFYLVYPIQYAILYILGAFYFV